MSAGSRLLGVDYGSVRVGLAVSDPDRKFAFPLETYARRDRERDAAYFREVAGREEVGGLRWSDIDLALSVAAGADTGPVVADWTGRMYREGGAVHHLDVYRGDLGMRNPAASRTTRR